MTDLSDEHRMLSDSLDAILAKGPERTGLWADLADLGILGLTLPGNLGGAEMGLDELVLISRRLGRVGAQTHFVTSEGVAVPLLTACDNHPRVASIADRVVQQRAVVALSFAGFRSRGIKRQGKGFHVSAGVPATVGWADADVRLLAGMLDGEAAVLCVPEGSEEIAEVPETHLLLHGAAAESALADAEARSRIVTGAFMVGAMEALLELTVDYLKTRRQFGQPLAAFQALQHSAVDIYIELQTATSMLDYGTRMFGAEPGERAEATAAMKLKINKAARFAGETAVQLHGGYGMTMESLVGRLFAAVTVASVAFGDARACLSQLINIDGLAASA